jgi:hypothetical protein
LREIQINNTPEHDERNGQDDRAKDDKRSCAKRHFDHIEVMAPIIIQ